MNLSGFRTPGIDAPALVFAALCGMAAAILTVASPLLGMAAIGGLIGYFALTRRAEIPFSLLILSCALPLQKHIAGIPLNMADGVIVAWGLAWPFLMMKQDKPFRVPFMVWAALPLVACATLSLVTAVNPGGSFKQVIRLVEWFIVLPVLIASLKSAKAMWTWMGAVFIAVPSLFALDGVVEVFNHGKSLSQMIGIHPPVPNAEFSRIRHTFDVSGRAGSTFGGAQGLAMYLTMMMAVVVSLTLLPPRPALRKGGLLSLLICSAGMVLAKSRGGFLGSIVMLTSIVLSIRPRLGIVMIIFGGFVFSGGLFWLFFWPGWDGTLPGLIPGRASAVLDRLIIWGRALQIWSENPFIGVGFAGFHDAVYQNGGINLNVPLGYESLHCHNTYLEVLTGTGLFGFVSYLGFLAACMTRLVRAWINRSGAPSDAFILAAIGALAAYMMFGMVDMLFLQNMHILLISILSLGMMAAENSRRGDGAP